MDIEISDYDHFSFDLWLTLIKSNPEFKEKRNLLFKDFFSIEKNIDKVTQVVRYYDVLCNQMNEKTGSHIDTFEIYLFILNALDVNLEKISISDLEEFYTETQVLFFQYKPVLIFPEIKNLFIAIKEQDKNISITSNTGFIKGKSLRNLLEYYELNEYFSFQLYSDEIGFSKPNSLLYKQMIEKAKNITHLELQINKIVHIGDNLVADYQGAIDSGIQSILIKNQYSEIQL